MIRFSNVSLRRGAKLLLERADAVVNPGERIGLIGANGSGKSSVFALLRGDSEAFLAGMERMHMLAPGAREGVRAAVEQMLGRIRGEGTAPLALGASRVLALKDEAKRLLEETPGLQLPNDLLLYAKTLSYLFALGAELAPEVDMMKLTVPWLLRFLAERDAGPALSDRAEAAAVPAAG